MAAKLAGDRGADRSEFECRAALPETRGAIRFAEAAAEIDHDCASEAERQRALQGGGSELDVIGGDTIRRRLPRRRPMAAAAAALAPASAPNSPATEQELARLVDALELERERIACLPKEYVTRVMQLVEIDFLSTERQSGGERSWLGKKKKKKKKTQSTVIRLLEKTSDRLAFRDLSCCSSHRASDHSCASNPSPRHRSREKGTQKRTERAVFGTKARGAFFPSSSTQSKKISLLQFLLPLSSSLSPSANPWLRPPSASPKPLSRSGPGMR